MELLTWKQDKKVVQIYLLGKADEVLADSTVALSACGLRLPCPSDHACGLAGMVVLCRDQAWQQVLTGTYIRSSSCLMLWETDT